MHEPLILLTMAAASLAGLSIVAVAGLKGWRGWLDVRRLEIAGQAPPSAPGASPGTRIELADLKERVRKLEAIAAGVDL